MIVEVILELIHLLLEKDEVENLRAITHISPNPAVIEPLVGFRTSAFKRGDQLMNFPPEKLSNNRAMFKSPGSFKHPKLSYRQNLVSQPKILESDSVSNNSKQSKRLFVRMQTFNDLMSMKSGVSKTKSIHKRVTNVDTTSSYSKV